MRRNKREADESPDPEKEGDLGMTHTVSEFSNWELPGV